MPISPLSANNGIVALEVLIGGNPIGDTYRLRSVNVERELFAVPHAELVFSLLGDVASGEVFESSESAELLPGKAITIKAGYDGNADQIFSGLISHTSLKVNSDEGPQLIVYCKDKTAKMTLEQKVNTFTEQTNAEVLKEVLSTYSGIGHYITDTPRKYPQIFQADLTDWDFALSRAQASGLLLYAEDNKVFAQKPHEGGGAELILTYGKDVFEFEAEFAAGYVPTAVATGGNTAGSSRLAALRGHVSFPGHASPRLNTPIKLAGFGKPFNGEALISSIRHTISDGTWTTETGFGLTETNKNKNNYKAITTQNGFRIEFDDQAQALTVSSPGGNKVVLSDEDKSISMTDPHGNSVIMDGNGISLKSTKDLLLDVAGAISLNAPTGIGLNTSEISSARGNKLTLSDEDEHIKMTDLHGNSILMDSDGISLKSTSNILLEATADVDLKGRNVNGDGEEGVSMTGGATAEFGADGETIIKGAMVMIN